MKIHGYLLLLSVFLVASCEADPDPGLLREAPPSITTDHFRVSYAKPYDPPAPPPDLDYLQSLADGLETAYAAFVDRYDFDVPELITAGSRIPVRVSPDFVPKAYLDKIEFPPNHPPDLIANTTAHELFHLVQSNMANVLSPHVREGLADWSVDIVNAEYDAQNYKVGAKNRWLGELWTEGNTYSWSLFWKYVSEQEGRASDGIALVSDAGVESWGVDAIVEFHRALKVAYDDLGEHQAPFSIVETAFSQTVGDGQAMSEYYKRFLIALYTKDLGDPFRNVKPEDLTGGGPIIAYPTTRWDFVEDEEAGYDSLALAQDGQLLEKNGVLSFRNDQSAYANGSVEFNWFAQAEPIRVNLAPDVVELYFEGQHPAESFAAGAFEDVEFTGLVHYTRLDGTGNYIRVLEDLEQLSATQFALYGNSIGYPYNEYRAKHVVIFPFSWNPELQRSNAEGNTGRHYKFKLYGRFP